MSNKTPKHNCKRRSSSVSPNIMGKVQRNASSMPKKPLPGQEPPSYGSGRCGSGVFREETKGRFAKGRFWRMCPRSGFRYRRPVSCTLCSVFLGTVVPLFVSSFQLLGSNLSMGRLRGAVFRHGGGARKQPIKQPTHMPTSTMPLMGLFPSLMGRFPTLMRRFSNFVLRGRFTS